MLLWRMIILVCLLLSLEACSAPQGYQAASIAVGSQVTPMVGNPTEKPAATDPSTSTSPALPLLERATKTLEAQAASQTVHPVLVLPFSGEASGDQPVLICSPLGQHTLSELPEIISSPYAPPPPGREERHHGIDFSYYSRDGRASIRGESVRSVLTGYVAAVVADRFPYGNMLIVETPPEFLPAVVMESLKILPGESLYSLYAHLENPPKVDLGELVTACQEVGDVGQSGNAGVSHLHLEMRLGPSGEYFSSLAYYDLNAAQEEKENYLNWRTSGVFRHFDPMLVLNVSH